MKVVMLESLGVSKHYIEKHKEKLQSSGHKLLIYQKAQNIEEKKSQVKDADAIILTNTLLEKEVIKSAEKLKFIDVAFTGIDHIPMDECNKRGIVVSNASGYATHAVAELCICFMIELLRNIRKNEDNCRNEKKKTEDIGKLLHGKTVGVIGAGKIGREVAKLVKVFGCKVIAYNRSVVEDKNVDQQVSLEELLKKSDIVSIHCPLTEDTRKMIGQKEFSLMKKDAIFINTARSKIVDNDALAQALIEKKIAGAGIDVFDHEPPLGKDNILLTCPNTIVTPHVGYETIESLEQRANIVFDNLYSWLEGKIINRVN